MSQKVQKPPSVEVSQSNVITPLDLINRASESGTSVDDLAKLWELHQSYTAAQSKSAFERAITAFRAECPMIEKTREGHNYKYAGRAETLSQLQDLLATHDLSVRWKTDQLVHEIAVTCIVTHVDGHSEETRLVGSPDTTGSKNSIQAVGSTVSYLERYTLMAILGLATIDQDNDGVVDEFITAAEAAHLEKLANQVEANKKKFLAYLKVESFAQIPADQYSAAEAALKKKGAAK